MFFLAIQAPDLFLCHLILDPMIHPFFKLEWLVDVSLDGFLKMGQHNAPDSWECVLNDITKLITQGGYGEWGTHRWLNVKEVKLHCFSNGVTSLLHWAIDMWKLNVIELIMQEANGEGGSYV